MSTTATVGFFPTSGKAAAAAGKAVGETPAADGPLGLFGALLQMVSRIGDDTISAVAQQATSIASGTTPDDGGVTLGFEQVTAIQSKADQELPPDLLTELSNILDALATATEAGTGLDPALEEQATTLIETIAVSLGVPLPVVMAAEAAAPAIAALAGAALEGATKIANVPGAPAVNTDAQPDGELPAPSALTQKVAERLTRLAAAVESTSPALAERLAALGTKIAAGDIDIDALLKAKVAAAGETTEDGIDPALLRLLSAAPDPKPTQAKSPFSAATLNVPTEMAGTDKPISANVATGPDADLRIDSRPESARPEQPANRPATAGSHTPMVAEPAGSNAQPTSSSTAIIAPAASIVTADTKAMHAAYAAPVRQINIPQVAVEIVRQVQAGASRFQIRLDPPELGRIDVKLDMDSAGNVHARMTVDRPETLDLMQRDQRVLERALAQAGLDSAKTNLEFSLRQNPFAHQEHQQRQDGGQQTWSPIPAGGEADAANLPPPHVITYRAGSPGGVNLFV